MKLQIRAVAWALFNYAADLIPRNLAIGHIEAAGYTEQESLFIVDLLDSPARFPPPDMKLSTPDVPPLLARCPLLYVSNCSGCPALPLGSMQPAITCPWAKPPIHEDGTPVSPIDLEDTL